ncbi:glycine C-acetyltransferase [Stratiformator vulcanicus]|uniref:2-amino-3-ketobutyrate coenzyme A ligase n=1 Tax=Stratiformator vulcanicus TaxID=2527980 RepID=A0A517R2C3_9PLAN|nr:glycine C-acetyltransferase [Stratiformator vulcanicus]QDT38030.1 2-amino-3-ketobutyrate coenzyme A ligase [Stratiformator vulcanicus]
MRGDIQQQLADELSAIEESGLTKSERILTTPQAGRIKTAAGNEVLNLCANNYLGLAGHPEIIEAAHKGLDEWGFGLASVRFICGTQSIHKQLEVKISEFLGTEDTILYASCFDANGGLFETILGPEDAVISDSLNHASIIDGIRLCKAQRFRYANNDMADLEKRLKESTSARRRIIATDGVFSMDGTIANLPAICELADRYNALVMFDDCHATGFLGATGRGTHEFHQVQDRVDIITGTLGKALGGASGGYTSGRKEVIELLRQRSRPYLFSNTVAPPIVTASLRALELVDEEPRLRERLWENTRFFREEIGKLGYDVVPGEHPIVPIMLGDAKVASTMAERLLERGVYVVAFSFPVVPKGLARIRTQMSAALSKRDLEFAVEQFAAVKDEFTS